MKYFIAQPSSSSCGFTSLKILLSIINNNEDYKYISYKKDLNHLYTFEELIMYAKEYGTNLKGIEITDYNFIKEENKPFILLTKDNKHSVVIYKKRFNLYKVYDPNVGIKYISLKTIKNKYSNIALIVESSEAVNLDINKQNLIENSKILITSMFHLLSFALALVSLYFINSNSYFITPIIFMVFSLIMSIISKNLSLKYLEKFDDNIINNYKFDKRYYFEFCEYKKLVFVNKLKFISSLLFILFLFLITALTQKETLIIFTGAFLFGIIEHIFFKKHENNLINSINKEENEILKKYDSDKHRNINNNSYKLGRYLSYKKIFELFILFGFVMITSAISKIASLNYVVFYIIIGLFLLENTQNMMSFHDDELKLMKYQELLRTILNKFKN